MTIKHRPKLLWLVTATIAVYREIGNLEMSLPAFILDGDANGITQSDDAERIVKGTLNKLVKVCTPIGYDDSSTIHVTVSVYNGPY